MYGTQAPPPVASGSSPSSSPVRMPVGTPVFAGTPAFPSKLLSAAHERSPSSVETRKFTTAEGVKTTLLTFFEFNILLKRVIEGSSADMPVFTLEEFNHLFAERRKQDIIKVESRRDGCEMLATKHPEILLDYNIYLRGILDELAKSNLMQELEQVEKMLAQRNIPKETQSSSPPRSTETSTSKGQELPSTLKDAWDKVGQLAEFKAQLAVLRTKFEFVDEEDSLDDKFAKDYRSYEAIQFLKKFNLFEEKSSVSSNDCIKSWHKGELTKVSKAVAEAFSAIKKHIDLIDFLPSADELDDCELSSRVIEITKEFLEDTALSNQVLTIRKLQLSIQKWKEIVTIENKLEHLRDAEDRARLHRRMVHEIACLRDEVSTMDVGQTMNTIREMMDKAIKASDDIKKMYAVTEKTLEIFDSVKETSTMH